MKKTLFLLSFIFSIFILNAQEKKVTVGLFDGFLIGGHVDNGGFINFTGPNISYTYNHSKILIGMLPSLKFKEDKESVKNAFFTPNLGIGITYAYKKTALQLPFYYKSKTTSANGKWVAGVGIGIKLK